ncbi:MAG TPA: OmpH family outer membrane protein [Stellaceae bacterium]|jgi:outer membrane protein|nr:OmpH family outer membrane protein [Stellaceae bacterium]
MSAFRIGLVPLACLFALSISVAQAQQPAPAQPAPAPAATSPQLTVVVVDVQKLLQESKAAKMVRQQIEAKRAEYAKEISHQEDELRKERDTLQRQQASLSQEALNAKGREFQGKVNDLDRTVQSKRQALEKSNADALEKIQQSMLKIITGIAKDRKANLVLQRSELVLFDQQFDVTDQVLQKLDEEMPTMTVTFVEPAPVTPTPAPTPAKAPAKKR